MSKQQEAAPPTAGDLQDERSSLPVVYSPEDVARHFGWSVRAVRKLAREIGACHSLGNRMILTGEDIAALLSATKVAGSGAIKPKLRPKSLDPRLFGGPSFEELIAQRKRADAKKSQKHVPKRRDD